MRKLFYLISLVTALLMSAVPAQARPLDEVLESGYLTVFVYEDFPPYSYEEDGKPVGIDIELGALLASELGVEVQYFIRAADENVDDDLRNNVWKGHYIDGRVADVMMHVPADRELAQRNDLVAMFGVYFTESMAVVHDTTKLENLTTFAPFAYDPISVEVDTVADFFLLNAFRGRLRENIVHDTTFTAAAKTFLSGETSALMAPKAQVEWVAHSGNAENAGGISSRYAIVKPPMPGIVRDSWEIGLAVKHDSRDLGYRLEDVIVESRESGKLEALFERYGVTYAAPQ